MGSKSEFVGSVGLLKCYSPPPQPPPHPLHPPHPPPVPHELPPPDLLRPLELFDVRNKTPRPIKKIPPMIGPSSSILSSFSILLKPKMIIRIPKRPRKVAPHPLKQPIEFLFLDILLS